MASSAFSKVRVRFAPSPTGYLHVGGARTAFYNYLFAKRNGGEFILRVEDTDEARSSDESLRMMIADLLWLNILWDEGPNAKTLADIGSFGPYKQSQRQGIYKKIADELLHTGKAYYCFMTDSELEAQREQFKAAGQQPHVQSPYENQPLEQALSRIQSGDKAVVRFKTRTLKKDYILKDLIRGEVKFPSDMVGDFVLLRSDGMPVYNFCCVVDDHLMQMSHILRAEEHLPNTLRQLMIYEAMNWSIPDFGHLSMVLDEDRQKLSKRRGASSCNQFREEGYLPEALKNFIALLGWSHPEGKEVMSTDEMKAQFGLDRIHSSGAIFDRVKLKWMNAQHLRALPAEVLWKLTEPFLTAAGLKLSSDPQWQKESVSAFKVAMETLVDAVELYRPLDDSQFKILPEADEIFTWEPTKKVLQTWVELLGRHAGETLTGDEFLKIQDEVKNQAGAKGKNLFQPIRVAVIGKPHGMELKILIPFLKKTSLIERANTVLQRLP